ncbi:MAG: membrane protein insertase YidC [Acidobacteriota bacterium]|nr:membrane protein insertase YidC [Acidobacteriota bacterium]
MPNYQSPQQEPGMERRLLLVFALTFLIIVAFQPLLKKYLPQPATPPGQTLNQKQTQSSSSPAVETSGAATPNTRQRQPLTSNEGVSKQAAAETEVVIENDLYRITFSNRGAKIKSWVLKKFDDDKGQPLELVNAAASDKYGAPLSLWTYDEKLREKLNSALYVTSSSGTMTAPAELTFDYADREVTVHKALSFEGNYSIHVQTSVTSNDVAIAAYPSWPAGLGDQTNLAAYRSSEIAYQYNSNTERLDIKKVSGGNTLTGPFNWVGVSDQYFAAIFLPDDPQSASTVTLRNPIEVPKDSRKANQELTKVDVLGIAVGNPRGVTSGRLYVGPKSLQILESVPAPTVSGAPPDLRSVVNFGFLGILARPLFLWLKWTYDHVVSNWGWAIVIQTLIINLALLPLRISSMKSALKMQKIQPQMNSIKEKYKKYSMRDPRKQEMNQEIAALMKQQGVSPAGGCLPMLIQMPFLFAYYRMLGAALDLRHAHWLWIRDLSSPDPIYLLPIGIVVTMLLTQRMTPQAGMDPAQQKMMTFMMPMMMGIISFNLASGLCLYWSEGNLIAIVQQYIMNRTTLGREMREMALKRARKKDK